jgi:trans-aconitate methyltransferase
MSRFPAEWLELREGFDHAARSERLVLQLREWLGPRECLRVVELGCGLGSGMRFVAPKLAGAQHWTLIDHDPDLLDLAKESPRAGVRVETRCLDLRDPSTLDLQVDLVSTQALLYLVSDAWLDGLSTWLVREQLPILAALSVDGRVSWGPEHPLDAEIQAAFRAHQLTDRGFGASPGPKAAAVLAMKLSVAGHKVQLARADWQVGPGDIQMLTEMISGTATAAAEAAEGITTVERVGAWRSHRMAAAAEGELRLTVGHLDLLALPR